MVFGVQKFVLKLTKLTNITWAKYWKYILPVFICLNCLEKSSTYFS